jgi:hypothetical protein
MAASPKEYREFAQDCLRWGAETKSDRHRQILSEMAKTWMQAALELESHLGLMDHLPMPIAKPKAFLAQVHPMRRTGAALQPSQ